MGANLGLGPDGAPTGARGEHVPLSAKRSPACSAHTHGGENLGVTSLAGNILLVLPKPLRVRGVSPCQAAPTLQIPPWLFLLCPSRVGEWGGEELRREGGQGSPPQCAHHSDPSTSLCPLQKVPQLS